MDRKLLDILVCPECKGPLLHRTGDKAEELICRTDRVAFHINEGVPVMLIENARVLDDDEEIA